MSVYGVYINNNKGCIMNVLRLAHRAATAGEYGYVVVDSGKYINYEQLSAWLSSDVCNRVVYVD
jgi:hypothetical protein